MRRYFIDGNNLIGKISELRKLNKNSASEKLIFSLQRHFANKKVKVTIFFDGYPSEKIKTDFELVYSLNRPADEIIKQRIEQSVRNKNLQVVSSDLEIFSYAKECGCTPVKSEEFYKNLISSKSVETEEKPSQNKINFYKNLFDVD